ncbi:hypothetical protein HY570_01345, partial [Candidatus Micrarchaeota archaeon]|nr:hypothetical protein [Candidatus Micrarchaeota archaeon]
MNISNLFTKDSLIKLFVILVVLAFILELFVLLPGQPVQQQPQTPITNENDSGSLPTVKDRFLGIAAVNATIVKYDDSLVLSGKDLGSANVIISDLIKTNKVSYKTNVNEDTLVLNLPANANVSEIVVSFRGLNLSIVGRASLRINGTAQFTAPNLSRVDVAIERDILLTLDVANKPVGSNVTVSLRALIEDGKIQQMEEPTIAPLSRNFLVNGTIVRVRQQGIVFAQVEWESRNEVNVSR